MIRTMKYGLMMACMVVVFYACNDDDEAPKKAPVVTTAALTNITTTSATAGGTITDDGNATITASGIVLSRGNEEPTLMDTVFTNTVATGGFTVNITGLEFNRIYHIRAYATNKIGTSYGEAVTLNTTNDDTKVRFIYNGEEVEYGVLTSSATGKKWLDRNLGASRVATSLTDDQAYGDLIQWGRLIDGHQSRTSATTDVLSTTDVPAHDKFITVFSSPSLNWRNPVNPNLWQGSTGINNPCPEGWHVPTKVEWDAEKTGITDLNTGFSNLKLTRSGYRWLDGSLGGGTEGDYWTSNAVDADGAGQYWTFFLTGSVANTAGYDAGHGLSVRCIKD